MSVNASPFLPRDVEPAGCRLRTHASGRCCCLGPKAPAWARWIVLGVLLAVVGVVTWLAIVLVRLFAGGKRTRIDMLPMSPATRALECPWGGVVPVNDEAGALPPRAVQTSPSGSVSGPPSEPAPAAIVVLATSVMLCWAEANRSSGWDPSSKTRYFLEHTSWWDAGPHDQSPDASAQLHSGNGPWLSFPMGNATHGTAEKLLPATTLSFRVTVVGQSRNDGEQNITSPELQVSLPQRGACGNHADMIQFRATYDRFQSSVQGCLILCSLDPDPDACASKCLKDGLGISSTCASCWVEMGHCTINSCSDCVFDPKGAACKACSESKCFPATVACSGIPMWRFPGV